MRRIDVARQPLTLLILLLGLVLLTSRTYADPEPRPEHRYLELGARVDARIADCPSDCDALPPGLGLSGFAHASPRRGGLHRRARAVLPRQRSAPLARDHLPRCVRAGLRPHSTFDPYVEIAGLAAMPVGTCPGGHDSLGGFGYRAGLGADWRSGPGVKLGAAAAYLRVRFGCVVEGSDDAEPIEGARTPPTLGGFGTGIAITAVPF